MRKWPHVCRVCQHLTSILYINLLIAVLYNCEMQVVAVVVHYKNAYWPHVMQEKPNYNWCRSNMADCRVRLLLV